MIVGFDVSPYLAGPCDTDALRKLVYSERISRVILAADTGPNYPTWYQACEDLGLRIDAYREVDWSGDYRAQIADAIAAFDAHGPVHDLWLTVESGGPSLAQLQDGIAYARAQVGQRIGGQVGIYTGAWYWRDTIGNPQMGSEVALWDANYQPEPVDFAVNYGGWLRATVRQYAGNYSSYGLDVDMDAWEE